VQRGANLDDGAGLAGEVSADAPEKRVFRGVACSPEAKTGAFRHGWEHRGAIPAETLQRSPSVYDRS
jgi:hypothetical protein